MFESCRVYHRFRALAFAVAEAFFILDTYENTLTSKTLNVSALGFEISDLLFQSIMRPFRMGVK